MLCVGEGWDVVSDGCPCLRCYPTLTWLTSFSLLGDVTCFYLLVEVEGSGLSPVTFRFFTSLSVLPRYLQPEMYNASCLGFMLYFSCILHWVVLLVNFCIILKASVAASSLVGLFTLSFLIILAAGIGIIVAFTLSAVISCRSLFFPLLFGSSNNPASVYLN